MNSSLVPLLLAYGEDLPDGATAPGGDAAAVEEVMLRTTRAALDGMPRPKPPAGVVEAVIDAARAAAAGSDLAAVRAVMAGAEPAETSGEHAILRSTWLAVERLERPAPPASAIETIVRHAATAARESELAPVRRVLSGEDLDAGHVEGRLLATTLDVVSRLPRQAPPADVVAAVLAAAGMAARESDLAPVRAVVAGGPGAGGAEAELLRTTWQAVERMPRHAPPVEAVHAVLAAANAALPASRRAQTRADRAPIARRSTLRLFAYITTAFAFVGLVSVALWVTRDGRGEFASPAVATEDLAVGQSAPGPSEEANGTADSAADADLLAASPTPSAVPTPVVGGGYRAGRPAAVPAAPPPSRPPIPANIRFADAEPEEAAMRRQEALRPAAAVGLVSAATGADVSPGAGLAGAPPVAPAWEAGADVRLLSLRLATLQAQNSGVDWGEPPTAIGGAEDGAAAPAGFDAVGTRTAPARFQVRVSPND